MTELRLHDTMAREKRVFAPGEPDRITMYVCGPTVYGRAHIGNARPAVVFDVLARVLRHLYPDRPLVYARNVTDVDDKIIAAAEAEQVGYRRITEKYYKHYLEDMGALNVLPPDFAPRATAFVPRMIGMIERLIECGHAYEASGHVLFHVPSDPNYAQLSRRDADAIAAGARVEVAPYKRDSSDFVLWKPAGNSAEQVALSFESPWGRGRPGWHIECSAMIEAKFGETIDIHGGGLDLIFPHHENELAQSRCAHEGAPLARYWVHNGFLSMAGSEKMSKSLGNVVTPAELLAAGHHGETLRLSLLSAHYRQPLEWSEELIAARHAQLRDWYRAKRILKWKRTLRVPESVLEALADDLNTPAAIAAIDDLVRRALHFRKLADDAGEIGLDSERRKHIRTAANLARQAWGGADLLGLLEESSAAFLTGRRLSAKRTRKKRFKLTGKRIEALMADRAAAKGRRDFAEADRIRAELAVEGVLLEDGPDGTIWRRA